MQKTKIVFAYKAGFRRLWLVITILWLAIVAVLSTQNAHNDPLNLTLVCLGPPAALYLLGVALVWIVEGFARVDR